MQLGRSRRDDTRGSILVELAMVMPVVFALLLGVTTGGQAYATKISIVEAVREGTRYGASLKLGVGPTAVTAFETSVVDRVVGAAGGALTSADVCVKFALPTGGTDCGVSDPSGASAEPTIHLVKVSASKPASLQFFLFSTSVNLKAKLVVRYERDTG